MSITTLKTLFAYKAWANSELYALLSTLPSERGDQLHACIRTLHHIYVVDRLFRARLAGEPEHLGATISAETPTLAQLRHEVASTDSWYVSYVSSVAEPALLEVLEFTFADGDHGRMSREEILHHVIVHGGYHRGNVGQILEAVSVAPPRDLYTRFLHQSEPLRRGCESRSG